jgi:hypothetical protein
MKIPIPKLYKILFLLFPVFLYGIGGGLNQLVCALNHGMMPVEIPKAFKWQFPDGSDIDETHTVASSETVLRILDDRIPIQGNIESVGDEFIDLSTFVAFPFLGIAAILVAIKREPVEHIKPIL